MDPLPQNDRQTEEDGRRVGLGGWGGNPLQKD